MPFTAGFPFLSEFREKPAVTSRRLPFVVLALARLHFLSLLILIAGGRRFVSLKYSILPCVWAKWMCEDTGTLHRIVDIIGSGATCRIHANQVAHSLGNFMVGA